MFLLADPQSPPRSCHPIHAPGRWPIPASNLVNLPLQQLSLLITENLTHEYRNRLLVENGDLLFPNSLLAHRNLLEEFLSSRQAYLSKAKNTSVIGTMRSH